MPKPSKSQLIAVIAITIFITYVFMVGFITPTGSLFSRASGAPEGALTMSTMMEMIDANEVERAYWYNGRFSFDTKDGQAYTMNEPISFMLQSAFTKLAEHGVDVVFGPAEGTAASAPSLATKFGTATTELFTMLLGVIPLLILGVCVYLMRGMVGKQGFGGWPHVVKDYPTRFSDIAGHKEVQLELEEIKTFLKNPAAFEKVGAKPPKGVLMVGPQGTGKTMLAKALAGECGATFIAVSGSDFSSMFVGQGKAKVKQVYDLARKKAPSIVFIDEIDSLARKRGADINAVGTENDRMVNQLLVEMDGFAKNGQVITIGATNRVDVLDPAALRPGRFDRQIYVGLPDIAGRRDILTIKTKDKPLTGDVDLDYIARGTPAFSGADLENLVNEAAIFAARDAREQISASDFQQARDKVIMGVSRPSVVIDKDERKLIAYHEAGHALAATLSKHSDPVHQATIIPRGQSLGSVVRLPEKDRTVTAKVKLLEDLIVLMAGRAAEEIVFGADAVTNGAASDIQVATSIATSMTCEWGMTSLGLVRGGKLSDGTLTEDAHKQVSQLVANAHSKALQLLKRRRSALNALANALQKDETLTGDQVRKVIDDHPEKVAKQADLLEAE